MADVVKWDESKQLEWEEWVATRPEIIKSMCAKWPPKKLYKLKTTNQLGWLYSYAENGTVKMIFVPDLNRHPDGRSVFGIDPNNLEEAEWPGPDYLVSGGRRFGDTETYKGLVKEGLIT